MFDIDKILGAKKSKKKNMFPDMKLSQQFGKNNFSDMIGNITKKPLNNMGASIKKQNEWKTFSHQKRNNMRRKHKDSDGDRIPNPWDCDPFNVMKQDIRFGRKPNKMEKTMWEKQKNILNKSTQKENTGLDPMMKMNTILENDYELKRLKKVNPVFHDDDWQSKYNEESKKALKLQGYNEDDAIEFLGNKNKTKTDMAEYFAQELAKNEKIGHLFPGAIPDIPISREEGKKRYDKFQTESQFISGIGTVSETKESLKNSGDNTSQRKKELEMQEQFEYEQEQESRNEYENLKNKPYNDLSYDEQEFVDAMATEDMTSKQTTDYYNNRAQEINANNITDRWQTYDNIFEKEYKGKPLSKEEKNYQKYHDLVEENYSKLSPEEKDFVKTYRYEKEFDEDILEGETDEVDSEDEFYKWKDNKQVK